jgi:hypothetical protein
LLVDIHGRDAVAQALQEAVELGAYGSDYLHNILAHRRTLAPLIGQLHLTRGAELRQLEVQQPDCSRYQINRENSSPQSQTHDALSPKDQLELRLPAPTRRLNMKTNLSHSEKISANAAPATMPSSTLQDNLHSLRLSYLLENAASAAEHAAGHGSGHLQLSSGTYRR